jgi:hypothetical protein
MSVDSLLWQYASLPSMVKDAYKEPKAVECVQQIELVEPILELAEPPVKTVQEAIRRRRLTIKKNGRYSRVKTKRRHLN